MSIEPRTDSLVAFKATEQLVSHFTAPEARRGVWCGAAFSRRQAAACAVTPDDYRFQIALAECYEQRAAQELAAV